MLLKGQEGEASPVIVTPATAAPQHQSVQQAVRLDLEPSSNRQLHLSNSTRTWQTCHELS